MARLIYVSNNVVFPDGKQNPFFLQEKQWLLDRFGTFDVVCPKGIYRCQDTGALRLCSAVSRWDTIRGILSSAFDPEVYKELAHMHRDKALSVRNVLKLFRFSTSTARMCRVLRKSLLQANGRDVIVYSYWMSFDAAAVAKIKTKNPHIYAVCRAHSYEIQLERNTCNPYLMKNLICKNMDKIAFIAEDSKIRFCSYYKDPLPNACVQYLGSDKEGSGYVARGKKETLTVLTCSSIVPVKRLDRMIKALEVWQEGQIHWLHIGDGPDGEMIRTMARERLDNNPLVTYEFVGFMENRQVHELLRCDKIDVFVNCSKAEGVPVSVMEAMSVGLPVIAPKMFGIPELVGDGCGLLFEQTEDEKNLFVALKAFAAMDKEERETIGAKAYDYWKNKFCLQTNLEELFSSAAEIR